MGNWTIIISGTGQHHNNGSPNDADVLARVLVRDLINAGHSVSDALFEVEGGATEDISGGASRGMMKTDNVWV